MNKLIKLSNDHSLNQLVDEYYEQMRIYDTKTKGQSVGISRTSKERNAQVDGFKDGFKAHQELTKDKMFTIEDTIQFTMDMIGLYVKGNSLIWDRESLKEFIKQLPTKTQQDIEFVDGKLKLI